MTARPCGQKNRTREMIQSQMVTPPLAAMEGTTLRLKMATTKSRTRSRRPRARISWGWAGWVVVDKIFSLAAKQQVPHRAFRPVRHDKLYFYLLLVTSNRGTAEAAVSTCFLPLQGTGMSAPHGSI